MGKLPNDGIVNWMGCTMEHVCLGNSDVLGNLGREMPGLKDTKGKMALDGNCHSSEHETMLWGILMYLAQFWMC